MPKIYEYFGFIFYFYSNEHEPIHVHVSLGDKESIFDLIMSNGELIKIMSERRKVLRCYAKKTKISQRLSSLNFTKRLLRNG